MIENGITVFLLGMVVAAKTRAPRAHYPACYWRTSPQAELLTFKFFSSSAMILLAVWSANGDGIVLLLTSTSSKVNLLSDDTYRCS